MNSQTRISTTGGAKQSPSFVPTNQGATLSSPPPVLAAVSLQHLTNGKPLAFADEENAQQWQLNTQFSYSQAIVWQIKFIISSFLTKKTAGAASAELSYLAEKFGSDFDKYLIRELVEQIDLKDPNKVSKDKNEAVKSQLLAQELSRMCLKPEFLKYFDEIAQGVFGDRYAEFHAELSRRLKLSTKMQLMVALSLAESCPEAHNQDCYAILKQKLVEYEQGSRQEALEDYAVHRLSYILSVYPEFQDEFTDHPPNFLKAVISFKARTTKKQATSSMALRVNLLDGDLLSHNPSYEDPSMSMLKIGSDFDRLCNVSNVMQPWEVLSDLGYYSNFDYQVLTMVLQDFKDINERTMANTILHLALNNKGEESPHSRITFNIFKSNKTGDPLKKEQVDKSTIQWNADAAHFARAFRENFSNLNWLKVFESFTELDQEVPANIDLESHQFDTFIHIFNKSKPQNLQIPIALLLEREWKSPALQFSVLTNAINAFIGERDRTFNFTKNARKIAVMSEVPLTQDVSTPFFDVWSSPEIIEILSKLSNRGLYQEVKALFDGPAAKMPEYFLFAISKTNLEQSGSPLILDDMLSQLMPNFLNNQQSIVFLKRLWDFNQNLMIRAICECCRHEQRVINLSRVLDITQDIKDSLIKIVYCNDYDFAVNLGILAGQREFLHYDVWLKERIKKVGTPFVQAFIKYINEQILIPCKEYMLQQGFASKQLTPEDQETIEKARDMILERAHMSKERLCMTMEHLENPANFQSLVQNPAQFEHLPNMSQEALNVLTKIAIEVQDQIKDLVAQYTILFPKQVGPTQSTEEIDKAANEYFQTIFSAEPHEVDERIGELIITLQAFQKSQVVKEQEIYACVLHGLFDEYRFLHKYPHVYLTKIAKLFGAIIKNRLLNNVLQGIALKFVIEAFRRDGKRLMFGIIVVKEFLECLPEFPKQFQEIYQNKEKIQQKDPELFTRIENLYRQTMMQYEPDTEPNSSSEAPAEESSNNASEISFNDMADVKGGLGADSEMFPEINKEIAAKEKADSGAPPAEGGQGNVFKQMGTNSTTFVPSNQPNAANKTNNLRVNTKQPQNANRKISPQIATQAAFGQQSTQLGQVNKAQPDKKAQQVPQVNTQSSRPDSLDNTFGQNPLNTNLNIAAAAFQRGPDGGQIPTVQPGVVHPEPADLAKRRPQLIAQQQQNPGVSQIAPTLPSLYMQQNQTAPPQNMVPGLMPINVRAKSFRPTDFNIGMLGMPSMVQFQANEEHIAWQKTIDQKVEEAKTNKQHRLRFEDLIEDYSLEQPPQSVIDQIKLKCNNTGKNNFKQNLESIKELVVTKAEELREKYKEEDPAAPNQTAAAADTAEGEPKVKTDAKDVNLTWFIHYILTKRISGQNQTLYSIYIELIRQIGNPEAITKTIKIATQIFQRSLLIDEVEFNKVANKVGGTSGTLSQIKTYLKTLGQFIGQLTLARNRPIRTDELDLKAMLIQGFQHESRRIIICFACNIIKECSKSLIFKPQNPWLNSILQILREIIDCLQLPGMKVLKDKEEIESELVFLFKTFNIQNINDILPSGILKASQISQFVSVSHEIELSYMQSKTSEIPIRYKPPNQSVAAPDGPMQDDQNSQADSEWEIFKQTLPQEMDQERLTNFKFIFQNMVLQEDKRSFLKSKFLLNDRAINDFMTKAVEESIEEILKPVVDRSVTIALITTKELVLKDFSYDSNPDRISEASEQIIQSLAGSLALVTCREPLRLQMNNFLLKSLKISCYNAGTPNGYCRAQIHEGMTLEEKDRQTKQEQFLSYYMQDVEEQLNEIAHETSKENLELGCKMIKNAVITKANTQVKDDKILNNAIDKRQRAQELGTTHFFDDTNQVHTPDLPQQLKPNTNGLTEDQFRVYTDFSKLNFKSKFDQINIGTNLNEAGGDQAKQDVKQRSPAKYDFTLESILSRLSEEKPLDSVTRSLMTIKLSQIKKAGNTAETSQEKSTLWSFCEQLFQQLVGFCDNKQLDSAKMIAEKLRLIFLPLSSENFSQKLLRDSFLEMEEMFVLNADLNVILLQYRIFSVSEWDSIITRYIHGCSGSLQSKAFEFLSDVVRRCIFSEKLFTHEMIPEIVTLLTEVTKKTDQHSEMLKFYVSDVFEQLKGQIPSDYENRLREYFKKWVELSQIEDSGAQEREMNKFFKEMTQLGIEKDEELLFVFCKIMIEESIELAQHTKIGQRRLNNNTLDYRFIDNFIKLVLCLLTSASADLNKMQFMSKIFEFIRQKLDDDHFAQQKVFNQKPYYRILMNILRAVTMSDCFNTKAQFKILYDLADLFKDLNPNNYPAFAFAWLALVSNQLFMPHFIKVTTNLNQIGDNSGDQFVTKNGKSSAETYKSPQYEIESQVSRLYKMKDLIVDCFSFIKANFIPGQQASAAMRSFYTATMNVVLVILKDYPQFLCDFHFNFVNALPEHAIQLKNLILAAYPKSIHIPPPFSQGLKVDPMQDQQEPRILSNFGDYIKLNGLKDLINNYFNKGDTELINDICLKMMSSKEKNNGKVVPASSVINAVVLCVATKVCGEQNKELAHVFERESEELFKQITINLNDETRLCFINSIVNELRYPNSHTFFFCIILLRLFQESKSNIQEQISTIFFERLQTLSPHPWGLMINFRELLQNQKYGFTKSTFILQNQEAIKTLMATKERMMNYAFFMPTRQHPNMQSNVSHNSYAGIPMQQFSNFGQPVAQMSGAQGQFLNRQPSGFQQQIPGMPGSFSQQQQQQRPTGQMQQQHLDGASMIPKFPGGNAP